MIQQPLIPPGEYPLELDLPHGATAAGVLTLPHAGRVTAEAYGLLLAGPLSARESAQIDPSWTPWSPNIQPFGTVWGRLHLGLDAVLLDAEVSHLFPERSVLLPDLALVGFRLHENPDLLFDEVTFQVGGLTELSGVSPLQTYDSPTSLTDGARFGVMWNADSSQDWTAANGDTVRLHYEAAVAPPQLYKMWLNAMPIVTVSGRARSVQDWMTQYVRPVAELAAFATRRPQPITVVSVSQENRTGGSVYGTGLNQKKYGAEPPQAGTAKPLVHCGPNGAPLPDLLHGWAELKGRYTTFADYFISISTASLPVTSRFIALIAALESFHSTDHPGEGEVTLYRRLEALVAQLPEEIRRPIEQAVEPLPPALQDIMQNPSSFWHVTGKARNNLAHGNNRRQSDDQLAMLTRIGHTVAVALVLHTFGVPTTHLASGIENGIWPLL